MEAVSVSSEDEVSRRSCNEVKTVRALNHLDLVSLGHGIRTQASAFKDTTVVCHPPSKRTVQGIISLCL
jgi:hypothetical protein